MAQAPSPTPREKHLQRTPAYVPLAVPGPKTGPAALSYPAIPSCLTAPAGAQLRAGIVAGVMTVEEYLDSSSLRGIARRLESFVGQAAPMLVKEAQAQVELKWPTCMPNAAKLPGHGMNVPRVAIDLPCTFLDRQERFEETLQSCRIQEGLATGSFAVIP